MRRPRERTLWAVAWLLGVTAAVGVWRPRPATRAAGTAAADAEGAWRLARAEQAWVEAEPLVRLLGALERARSAQGKP